MAAALATGGPGSRQHTDYLCAILLVLLWVCPLWSGPTAMVPRQLWGGFCLLGLWVCVVAQRHSLSGREGSFVRLDYFFCLLCALALAIVWRTAHAPNAVAAVAALLALWLASLIPGLFGVTRFTHLLLQATALAALFNAAYVLFQYSGSTLEPLGSAFGFLRQRNQVATLCSLGLLALYLLRPAPLLYWLGSVLLCAALAATCSRTGMLQVITLCMVALAFSWRQRRSFVFLAVLGFYFVCVAALPTIFGIPEHLLGRLSAQSADDGFTLSRLALWHNAWSLIVAHPLQGIGWAELAPALQGLDLPSTLRFSEMANNAHNLPLHFAAELGLPFTLLWLTGLALWVYRLGSVLTKNSHTAFATLALLVIGIHSLLEYPLWYAPFLLTTGFAAGVLLAHSSERTPAPDFLSASYSTPLWVSNTAALGLLAFSLYASVDYHRVSQVFTPLDERSSLYANAPMRHAQNSWLFKRQAQFALLLTTPLSEENAPAMLGLAREVKRFSPEPRVLTIEQDAKNLVALSLSSRP